MGSRAEGKGEVARGINSIMHPRGRGNFISATELHAYELADSFGASLKSNSSSSSSLPLHTHTLAVDQKRAGN